MAKKIRKLFAMLLTVCMVMSLLSIGASADEGGESVPESNFKCGMELHVHNADCYTPKLDCEKHVHVEGCYDEEGLTCTLPVGRDLNCDGHTKHGEDCYTTHVHEDACYKVTPASESWTCTETATEHVHEKGTCYTVIPESKTLTCELSTDPQLVCEIELHVHDKEACYVDHVHVEYGEPDSCYKAELTCELPEHPAHTESCLSPTGKGIVDAVIQQMTDAPELEDMQKARSTTYGFYHKKYNAGGVYEGTVEEAAAAYNAYIAACFANREAALQAYEDMPAELKPFVPKALYDKLTTGLDTNFKPKSVSVPRSEDEYNFMSVYQPCYEMSSHMVSANGGVNNDIPQTLLLVDTTADDCDIDKPYVSGVSNYEVMYCCDAETGYDGGIYYKRMNLEDSPYYDQEAAKHIRAIVMNSYPYVTLEEMEAKLPAQFKGLTRAEAIAAVQTAIWSYANGMTGYRYSQTFDVAKNSQWGNNIHDYSNEMYDWWYVGNRTFYVNETVGSRIDALVNYLTSLTPVDPAKNAVVITSMEVVGEPTPVFGSGDEYEVLLKVVLNSGGSDAKDTLMLTATAGSSGSAVTAEVNEGQTVYYMLVSAKSGDTISVELSGTQKLPRGVYFYEAKPVVDDEGNVITAARDVSQNLVGVAMGDIPISFTRSKLFTTDLELTDTAELQVQKVSESGNPLTGAEFTLYADVDGDNVMDPAKTYAVNDQGYVVDETGALGIGNLIPGTVYELKETKVPEGYVGVEGAARFEVVMVGEEAVVRMTTLPHGMAYTPNAEEILVLRVTNTVPSTGGGGGGGGGGSIIIPGGNEIEEIEEGDVPLTELPEEELEIPEEDVPLTELPEEDVPLAMAPATGDASVIWMALSALSGAGLFLTRKKREDEE